MFFFFRREAAKTCSLKRKPFAWVPSALLSTSLLLAVLPLGIIGKNTKKELDPHLSMEMLNLREKTYWVSVSLTELWCPLLQHEEIGLEMVLQIPLALKMGIQGILVGADFYTCL